jgi:diadenosine tetraphosphatase ApaH/serine/threonine PP2A family protein phosphatase
MVTSSELISLCDSVLPILQGEDSLVSIPFPARVYGDIHGNLPDLIQFFNKYAWPDKRKGDILSMNYVFMGDFVDRGSFSVEVVALLFSLKILYPTRVLLIRGNHEDRNMNYNFGFRRNCIQNFGPTDGGIVWERVNECFDYLPIAGLIGHEVLCIHGGIGDSIDSVADLVGIEKPIVVPPESVDPSSLNKVDRVVIDALWSDPVDGGGNHLNPRGNGASRYTAERVKNFVSNNNLQFIIRAHECVQNGFEYFADGLVLTVFSASSYCNQYTNDGGMVVVVKNDDGSLEEHAQVIKTNPDTRIGWDDSQYRQPSPMRQLQQFGTSARPGIPFAPITYPASPGNSRFL